MKKTNVWYFKFLLVLIVSFPVQILPFFLMIGISDVLNKIQGFKEYSLNIWLFFFLIILYALCVYFSYYLKSLFQDQLQIKILDKIYIARGIKYNYVLKDSNIQSGEVEQYINETANVAKFYFDDLVFIIPTLFSFVFTFIILFLYQPFLTILLCLSLVLLLVIFHFLNKRVVMYKNELIKQQKPYFSTMDSIFKNAEQVKYYNLFDELQNKIYHLGYRIVHLNLKSFNLENIQATGLKLLNSLFIVLFIILVKDGRQFLFGDVFLIITLLQFVSKYIVSMQTFFISYKKFTVSKSFVKEIFASLNNEKQKGIVISDIHDLKLVDFKSSRQKNQPVHYIFEKGQVYLITGENGCGKTTFFDILMGINIAYEGHIYINDKPIERLNITEMLGTFINYMTQDSDVLPYIDLDEKSIHLSRGERQILMIEKMISQNHTSCLYLLDEPTASLDQNQKHQFINLISKIKKEHIVLIISHDPLLLNTFDCEVRF